MSYQLRLRVLLRSPDFVVLRSRSWVAEEGEIFRKGNKLLGPEEMEGEYAGEDLRIEVHASYPNGSKQITYLCYGGVQSYWRPR